ncbi:MAG: hypothetical protein A3C58_02545 [Candidatus Staskawiczbacteria bacterium RIFCSPHIGHO2_02_FULL_34_10]|uniref:N-acetyltransferase domain-containing protein n=2 Tax=Candidatus Staskawicziibacteriota TaxID=1817916 RepID=A0A1G2HLE2_9BACT|nr:MAG: hypothetical protein A2639_00230 [Candidatus Staskawiczbacteria bacterium RIFCSPHIGHO2_01_FULL_34_27]OGZ66562.1 MAG: hypothetical protein A3C58_02545 [Candidatus Staskawiczbacteria bacterium RIFCSPHIGHO2_02_FULL_34_10]
MEILPNTGKNLIIEVDGRRFTRYPIRTKLITSEDSDIVEIVQEYAGKYVESGDIVFISEKAVAITQGRSYPLEKVKASWLAQFLSRFVMKTPVGIGLGSPQTMQLAIEEVGVARILTAAIIGALGKIVGIRGIFYMIAGHGARSIDGAVPYAIPPYNTYVSKGPLNASEVSEKTRVLILEKISTRMSTQDLSALVSKKKDIGVAIVDANDIGVNILGASKGVDKKLVAKIIKDNPLGQSDEQTPIGIIREIPIINTGLRKAELSDIQNLSTITRLLHINIPHFLWDEEKFIKKQIKQGEYFLIENNGVVVGAMSLRARNSKIHIETLVVKEEFQSKGFGTEFIEFAKKFSLENGYDKLHAYSFLEYNMEKFYLKKGFIKLGHLGYYKNCPYQCFEMKINNPESIS